MIINVMAIFYEKVVFWISEAALFLGVVILGNSAYPNNDVMVF
jgi:hypothetical protein